jgi:hypothetical protein
MNEDHYLTGRVIDGKIYVDNADLWPFLKRKNAEIKRLREVLRVIANNKNYTSDMLARAALEESGMTDYETLKSRVDTDDGTYWWALTEIERLREALCDCHHVLHKLMAIVPGNDAAVDEMAKVMAKARAALEGK